MVECVVNVVRKQRVSGRLFMGQVFWIYFSNDVGRVGFGGATELRPLDWRIVFRICGGSDADEAEFSGSDDFGSSARERLPD